MASYQDMLRQIFRASHFPVDAYAPAHWDVTQQIIGELRVLPYVDQWKKCLEEKWFHLKLEDHSLFVFNETVGNRSYHFLHSPIAAESFRTYLNKKDLEYTKKNQAVHAEDYAMLFETSPYRNHVTPIRYDVDLNAYRAGRHPVAHIHIGLENNIRLAVRREMSPLAFSLFVMRQMYPESWEKLLTFANQFKLQRVLRDGLELVNGQYWNDHDEMELHLA